MESTILFFLILLLHICATSSTRIAYTFASAPAPAPLPSPPHLSPSHQPSPFPTTPPHHNFSALFVFGDSIMDTGNNNYISTIVRANYPPYGSAFPNHTATGRFSNGKLIDDLLAAALGLKQTIPPYLDPSLSDEDLKTGVVFASAGSGYDDLTNLALGVIPGSKQSGYFTKYLERLKGIVGQQEATRIAKESLIFLTSGTNDFIVNFNDAPARNNISAYQDHILGRTQNLIKLIYGMGPRTFAVTGLPPIGCLPLQMSKVFVNLLNRTCIKEQNTISTTYNSKLANMLHKLQGTLPGSKLVYIDIFSSLLDMAERPEKYGFTETRAGCCATRFLKLPFPCNPLTPPCQEPSKYLFWDAIHPSAAGYDKLAKILFNKYLPILLAP